jgi:PAS domain S-box-containing protein
VILHSVPIHALSRKENELHGSEEKHRKLIETASDAIIVFDKETDAIRELNQSALRMLGVTRERAIGNAHSSIYPAEDAEKFKERLVRCAESGTILHDGLFLSGPNGVRIEVEASASVVDLGGREVVQSRFTDITDRKRDEERLVRAERMAALGTLTAGIAHQFNNIHASALGYLQILKTDADISAASRQYLECVQEAIDRAVQITSRLLVLSGPVSRPPSPVLVGDVLRGLIPFLRPEIAKEGVKFDVELKDVRPVQVERVHLLFIVHSLLDNARQALIGQPRRELRVETANEGEWTILRVVDTGIGIAGRNRAACSHPFSRGKGSTPRGIRRRRR